MNKVDGAALRQKIQKLEGLTDDERAALLELAAGQRRYGLVWEDRTEDVEERLREQLPVLVEDKSLRIVSETSESSESSGFPNHILIEGDNLEALTALSYTHEGKVDVIYIDPPYNTGNRDFVYNDSFVDSEDSYRHSKWLSFMNKRLRIAKRLLSDRGVIFISIDDNEQANLKLLCDEVFGERNFVTCFPWHSRQSLQNDTDISVNHEYLVCYAKNRRQSNRRLKPSNAATWYTDEGFVFYPIEKDSDKYSNPDNDPRGPWKADPFDAPHVRPNLTYPVVNPKTGEQHLPPRGRCWRISPEKFASALADNRILFGKNGNGRPQMKVFFNEQEEFGSIAHSWLDADKYETATHGSKELQAVFDGDKVFTSPKPTALIIELLKLTTLSDKPATVLDFFAGSGTTLHAVMQLNKEDGGKRQCILVTNNENNICREVTYERNRRVIEGYTTPKGVQVEGLRANNLRYYRTRLLPRERTNRNMRALVGAATDLLCIKENIFEEFQTPEPRIQARDARLFSDGQRAMLVVYNEEAIPDIVEWLQGDAIVKSLFTNHYSPIKTYVFSPGAYAWDDDFAPVLDRVELCALPEAIYQAYKNVLPKKMAQRTAAGTSPKEGGEE